MEKFFLHVVEQLADANGAINMYNSLCVPVSESQYMLIVIFRFW